MSEKYPELHFPTFEHKIKVENGQEYIWESIRQSWILLTPEEWVRQNLIRYFVDVLKYPQGLMQVECSLRVGKMKKRFDLVVMDKNLQPWLICECKAPHITLDASVLQQASAYNSTLKCPYLSVTNGINHFCFQIQFEKSNSTLILPQHRLNVKLWIFLSIMVSVAFFHGLVYQINNFSLETKFDEN